MKKFIIGFLALVILAVGVGGFYLFKHRGSSETSTKYNEFSFISEDKDIDKDDFDRIDGQYYLSLDFIKEHIDDTVAYDKAEKTVIFTNDKGTRRAKVGETEGVINTKKFGIRDPIVEKNGKILIPSEIFIYDYPVELTYIQDKKLLLMDYTDVDYAVGVSTGDGLNMRETASLNSPIVSILNKDSKVYVYGEKGDFYKVREIEGYAGYIKKDLLDVEFPQERLKVKNESEKREAKKPLNLTWDYTYGPQSEESIEAIGNVKGLDVICPTWFSIKDTDLNIIDRGNQEYVNRYNSLGIDVWAYLDNSFDPELTQKVLSKSSSRDIIIKKTLELTKKYGLKGINIDFENTTVDDRDNITQFVRELSGVFKQENLLVSVDVTPQISSNVKNELYDRKALADVCDYVMLMAYDQHWSSSDKAGSVAQYKWVEGNLNVLFKQIPHEKMILGVPLYTRLWSESSGEVKSSVLSMYQTENLLATKSLNPKWDEESKQNYAEYSENNKKYKIWIEDSDSIEWKTSLVNKYNLAGVASWRKGFETDDIWSTLDNTISAYN
ncbi:glycosyl hydrolase family 18 protein [Anaerosphaera multitolerans]|uniref:Glycoside hydrolase n=1 Tax=Anaerosphaera multitolerans TaxID=2487351 RepID=A0A437S8X2_9FIRM|nr:glycosyl hydrolase family 18 protein [Anaerosphaera multitolerans]RVU55287.1 glycoside hydrolase [Anaerosphaera multitolerans]